MITGQFGAWLDNKTKPLMDRGISGETSSSRMLTVCIVAGLVFTWFGNYGN